uniref:Uncharacterized protein n=1 Tax=Lepeophtheirus salmonis TaxID=72036 RepID=A0A0K2TR20_LEPSM
MGTKECLKKKKHIKVMEWPVQSLDGNLIEKFYKWDNLQNQQDIK